MRHGTRTCQGWLHHLGRSNEHSVGLLGVPVEEFELDLDHVVEALAPLVDVVVAAVTAVHFAGGLSPISECRIIVIMSGNAIICWDTIGLER